MAGPENVVVPRNGGATVFNDAMAAGKKRRSLLFREERMFQKPVSL